MPWIWASEPSGPHPEFLGMQRRAKVLQGVVYGKLTSEWGAGRGRGPGGARARASGAWGAAAAPCIPGPGPLTPVLDNVPQAGNSDASGRTPSPSSRGKGESSQPKKDSHTETCRRRTVHRDSGRRRAVCRLATTCTCGHAAAAQTLAHWHGREGVAGTLRHRGHHAHTVFSTAHRSPRLFHH